MICICGKAAMDGKRCKFGATHSLLKYKPPRERVRLEEKPKRVRLDDDQPDLFKRRERL